MRKFLCRFGGADVFGVQRFVPMHRILCPGSEQRFRHRTGWEKYLRLEFCIFLNLGVQKVVHRTAGAVVFEGTKFPRCSYAKLIDCQIQREATWSTEKRKNTALIHLIHYMLVSKPDPYLTIRAVCLGMPFIDRYAYRWKIYRSTAGT